MKLLSLRATNFRGFIDTTHIRLKKINLLVGKNSIGKSSYARLWPIFNQGSKVQKRSPIIWNGNLVDFGTFQNILSRHAKSDEVGFEFKLVTELSDTSSKPNNFKLASNVRHLFRTIITLKINLISGSDDSNTHCTSFSFLINGILIEYKFHEDGTLFEVTYQGHKNKIHSTFTQERSVGFLIPVIDFFIKVEDKLVPAWSPLRIRLYSFLRRNLHQRLADERIHDICEKLNVICKEDEIISYCRSLPYIYKTWIDFLDKIEGNPDLLYHFYRAVTLSASELLIRDVDIDLRRHFASVNYIRPLRATAQRYYRRQELAVDNIDSEGANLAFFLASLTKQKLQELNFWLEETIDVTIKLDGEQGHLMITLCDHNTGRTDNMADMGFGFSQVLPLAVQAWISSSGNTQTGGRSYNRNIILVWEQPELHLHPAMQRKLARLIAKTAIMQKRNNITFIIETHSQSMINELGDLILSDSELSNDIQVLLFEQEKNEETTIKVTGYDTEGQLKNWPFGFLTV